MLLNIKERIIILSLLPKEGSFLNLKLVREIKEDLSFSVEEHSLYKITMNSEGMITWIDPENYEKEYLFNEPITDLIKQSLIRLDKEEKLEEDKHLSLYEKFVM